MPVRYFKSNWEMNRLPLAAFFERAARDGFDGAEVHLGGRSETPEEVAGLCAAHRMALVVQVSSAGGTPQEHMRSLDAQVERAVRCGAAMINGHLGSDFFGFGGNVEVLARAGELGRAHGLPFVVETHRGCALHTIPETLRYIEALPGLEIAADLSHFLCVHESDLAAREAWLDRIVPRCRHVHARFGHAQGPQVPHPMAPEWEAIRERHLAFWRKIAAARAGDLTVTPEAGPPPYMPTLPFTNLPVADAWEVNVAVRDWLQPRLAWASAS